MAEIRRFPVLLAVGDDLGTSRNSNLEWT